MILSVLWKDDLGGLVENKLEVEEGRSWVRVGS